MLKSTERILKIESGELSLPDEEKVEALTTPSTQVAGHLCSGRIHFLQMEKAARRGGEPPLRSVGGGTGNAGRGTKQVEDKDSGLGLTHHDAVRSGSPAGESPARECGKGAGQGDRLGKS